MYFHGVPGEAGLPAATQLPLIGEYHDLYQRRPEGWRIHNRRIELIFSP
jgi:hypothetical protein